MPTFHYDKDGTKREMTKEEEEKFCNTSFADMDPEYLKMLEYANMSPEVAKEIARLRAIKPEQRDFYQDFHLSRYDPDYVEPAEPPATPAFLQEMFDNIPVEDSGIDLHIDLEDFVK